MRLIIAEKPSVARNIATALRISSKKDGYYEGSSDIVSWCFGHLVGLAEPEEYDERYAKWSIEDLPIIPDAWKYDVSGDSGAKKQFKVLKSLMARKDVDELVCATDADREGELIFRLVYDKAGCTKPTRRLWTSSQEPDAIRGALKTMKPGTAYDGLAAAAHGRQRADWLVGMNLSRLYTKLYATNLPCGRVQTPVVTELVRRELVIKNFVPVPYWVVTANLGDFSVRAQFDALDDAESITKRAPGETAQVTNVDTKDKKTAAPRLYSLTTLQKDASRILGLSAADTLAAAQSLYEKKLSTYPRTDSQYLTSDLAGDIPRILDAEKKAGIVRVDDSWTLRDAKVLVNDSKVEGHPAITPCASVAKSAVADLKENERNVLALIAWRLVCALGESFAYTSTSVTVKLCDTDFTARGRVVKNDGWKAAERAMRTQLKAKSDKKSDEDDDAALPALNVGDTRVCANAECEERATKPPTHHSEESILDFMEHAGRAVEDDELASVLKAKGIGTPATRASIIEGVVKSGYAKRERKQLLPTEKAYAFVRAVSPALREPATTAEWEQQLAEVESGTRSLDDFMSGIEDFVRDTVKGTRIDDTLAAKLSAKAEQKVVGACPVCGQSVVDKAKSFACSSNRYERGEDGAWTRTGGCGFSMPKTIAGKKISATSAAQLLKRGRTSTLKGFKSKAGKTFEAALRLDEDGKVAFEFK